jgi:UDP-2-acetamido-3-amino-2,3-dideoxy-glucuronate N-acetyltransferase
VSLDSSYFVHECALCETREVGRGTRIWAFAHVMDGARIGSHCNIGDHAFIESGAVVGNRVTVKNNVLIWDRVTIDDEVFLGPNVVFTNDLTPRAAIKKSQSELLATRVLFGASLGANSTVLCGITIGSFALIAAGSVVNRDVPAHALMAGNPSRQIGWACRCGLTLDSEYSCLCGRRYELCGHGLREIDIRP